MGFATVGVLELDRVAVDKGVTVGCISVIGVGSAVRVAKGKVGKRVGIVVGGG